MLSKLEKELKKMEKESKAEAKTTATPKPAEKKIQITIRYGGYELEFNIPPVERAPKVSGIPQASNPKIDQELWYLRVQCLMGQELHHYIEESLNKLEELGVSKEAIDWIKQQFNLPPQQRSLIPLTDESEQFIAELREHLKNIVLSKFPDAPQDEVEKFVQNAIFNAITSSGWSNKDRIRRSAESYIRNLLRGV